MTNGEKNRLASKRAQAKFNILAELDAKGYNPTRVAEEIPCSLSNVSKVLNGKGNSKTVLGKLRSIGVPEKYLFDPEHKRKVA